MMTIPLTSAIAELLQPLKAGVADAPLLAELSFDTVLEGAAVGNGQPEMLPFLVPEYSALLDERLEASRPNASQKGLAQVLLPGELAKKAVAAIVLQGVPALPEAPLTTPAEEAVGLAPAIAADKSVLPPTLPQAAHIPSLPAAAVENAQGAGRPFVEGDVPADDAAADTSNNQAVSVAEGASAPAAQNILGAPLVMAAEKVHSAPAVTHAQPSAKSTEQATPVAVLFAKEAAPAETAEPVMVSTRNVELAATLKSVPLANPAPPAPDASGDELIMPDLRPVAKERPSQPQQPLVAGDRLVKAAEAVQAATAPAHAKASTKASEKGVPVTQLFTVHQPAPALEETAPTLAATKPTLEIPAGKSEALPANQPLPTHTPAPNVASAAATANKPFAETLQAAQTATPVEQIIARVKTIARPGSTHVRIQLDPAELGHVEMKIHVSHDGKTNMVVTAEHKHTLEILQRDTRGLEQLLADSGLKADSGSLSFHLRGEQQQNQQNFASGFTPKVKLADAEQTTPEAVTEQTVTMRSGLDIRV